MATSGPGASVSVGGITVLVAGTTVTVGGKAVTLGENAVLVGGKAVAVGGGTGVTLDTAIHAVRMKPNKLIPNKREFFFMVAFFIYQ